MSALLGVVSSLTPNNVISGFTFAATISSSLATYNVATAAAAAGWNETAILIATITQASGGEITGTANNAFDTGELPAGSTVTLTIENTAFTRGAGGTGGEGGIASTNGNPGTAGKTAINFQSNGTITIDSGGEISGGGGGGGGGGGFFDSGTFDLGSGGGGGGGFPNGAGGTGPLSAADGSAGTSGGGGAAGNGGDSGGNGGAGGNAATAGSAGSASTGSGGAAGAAGSAIEKNGFTVTVNNSGSINGDINA